MDADRFDHLTLLSATRSRRVTFQAMAGLAVGSALGALGLESAAAKQRKQCRNRWSQAKIKKFIKRAAKRHKQPYRDMLRVARCESNLDPCAVNNSGPWFGLYQFLRSTYKGTPYGKRDIFHPKHNAMAAGWMWKKGRRNEWVCQ